MANERLDIARFGIAKLIKDGGLCVPPNQREYSWREEHVSDLYQDLAKAISDGEPDYFLGSIVVARKNGSLEVFDGQQRLATTVILLAAIRDYYRTTKDEKRANIIQPEFLMSPDLETLEEQPKLTLSKMDHDFYLKRILSDDPNSNSLKRMEGTKGLEPATSAVTGQRSNQLNYVPGFDHRNTELVGSAGLEPATSC